MVQHNAQISGGNSGGPLVDKEKWHVRGINTLGIRAEIAQGIFFSVQMKQLRKDIDREIREHQEKNKIERWREGTADNSHFNQPKVTWR